jgi:hypothetical protein
LSGNATFPPARCPHPSVVSGHRVTWPRPRGPGAGWEGRSSHWRPCALPVLCEQPHTCRAPPGSERGPPSAASWGPSGHWLLEPPSGVLGAPGGWWWTWCCRRHQRPMLGSTASLTELWPGVFQAGSCHPHRAGLGSTSPCAGGEQGSWWPVAVCSPLLLGWLNPAQRVSMHGSVNRWPSPC